MALFGIVFSQSEYHYERARLSFESDRAGFNHLRHLHDARALDGKNPFVFSLSAHAQVAGIQPDMPEPARLQALGQADGYFSHARHLYPQDIFAAIGHAAVLEELGRTGEALERLREAREFAPDYGNLMLAEAEHHLRHGRVADAETMFSQAMSAAAFRDSAAARRGLMTVTEWKLIAEQDGIDWRVMPDPVESEPLLAGPAGYRSPAEAKVENRNLAGQALPNALITEAEPVDAKEAKEAPVESPPQAEASKSNADDSTAAP
jgi:tetratricopeptide (TPR) repeat protein